jgi:hypothetical protein
MFSEIVRNSGDVSKRSKVTRAALFASSTGLVAACALMPASAAPAQCQQLKQVGTYVYQAGEGIDAAVLGPETLYADQGVGGAPHETACYDLAHNDAQHQLNNAHRDTLKKGEDASPHSGDHVITYKYHAGPAVPGQ